MSIVECPGLYYIDQDCDRPQAHRPSQTQDMLPDLAGVPEQTAGDYGELQISPSLETGQSQYWTHEEDHTTDGDMRQTASSRADYPPSQLDDTRMALGHMTGGNGASNEMVEPASEDERLSMRDTLEAIGPIQHHLSQSLRPSMQSPSERPALEEHNSQFISLGDIEQEHQSPNSSRTSSTTHTETSRSSMSYDGREAQSTIAGAKLPTYDGSVGPMSTGESGKQEESLTTTQEPQVVSVSDISSLQLELKDPGIRRKLVEALQMQGILEEFGFKKESSPVAETRSEDVSQGVKPESYHPCTESGCDKKFMRPCELK